MADGQVAGQLIASEEESSCSTSAANVRNEYSYENRPRNVAASTQDETSPPSGSKSQRPKDIPIYSPDNNSHPCIFPLRTFTGVVRHYFVRLPLQGIGGAFCIIAMICYLIEGDVKQRQWPKLNRDSCKVLSFLHEAVSVIVLPPVLCLFLARLVNSISDQKFKARITKKDCRIFVRYLGRQAQVGGSSMPNGYSVSEAINSFLRSTEVTFISVIFLHRLLFAIVLYWFEYSKNQSFFKRLVEFITLCLEDLVFSAFVLIFRYMLECQRAEDYYRRQNLQSTSSFGQSVTDLAKKMRKEFICCLKTRIFVFVVCIVISEVLVGLTLYWCTPMGGSNSLALIILFLLEIVIHCPTRHMKLLFVALDVVALPVCMKYGTFSFERTYFIQHRLMVLILCCNMFCGLISTVIAADWTYKYEGKISTTERIYFVISCVVCLLLFMTSFAHLYFIV
eukprot:m.65267 g.65267  ORF g.65267 m.65267 type:complete len:450 (+) comp35313_c0_seq1:6-1355(+)